MNHEFEPALQSDTERYALAQQAATLLDEESAATAVPTKAQWRLPTHGILTGVNRVTRINRLPMMRRVVVPLLELVLTDELGCTMTAVIWDADVDNLHHRIVRVWGDMLEVRSAELERRRIAYLESEGVSSP